MKDIRKECVKAVFDDFDQCGDAIRPAVNGEWEEIDASRPLGHIVGYVDICVADLVDIVVDAINKEMSWMDDGGFEIRTFADKAGRAMAQMSFRTSTGHFDIILGKTEVQRIRRECGRAIKEIDQKKGQE